MSNEEKRASSAENQVVATEGIGFMEEYAGAGMQNLRQDDFTIGFLKILQPQSPELLEGGENYIPGAKAGMFVNSLNSFLYGNEVQLIPVFYDNVWIEWAANRGRIRGRHAPNSIEVMGDPYGKMTCRATDGSGGINDVVETQMFYVLVANHIDHGVLVLTLSKTGIRHGKRWNTMIGMLRLPSGNPAPYFSSVWTLKTMLNKNDQGSWYSLGTKATTITWTRFVNSNEFTNAIAPTYKRLEKSRNVDLQQIEGPVTRVSDEKDY